MSNDSTSVRVTADTSDFEGKVDALLAKMDQLISKAANIGVGGSGTSSGSAGGGSQAFQQSQQTGGPSGWGSGKPGAITGAMRDRRIEAYWNEFEEGQTELPYMPIPGMGAGQGATWGRSGGNMRNFGDPLSMEEARDRTAGGFRYNTQAQVLNAQGFPVDHDDALGLQKAQRDRQMQGLTDRQESEQRRMDIMHSRALQENEKFDQQRDIDRWGHRDRQAKDEDWYTRYLDKQDNEANLSGSGGSSSRMGGFARGALYGVGTATANYANAVAAQMATGVDNPTAMSTPFFGAGGALLGAGFGSLFGGFGGMIGGRVGEQIGTAVGGLALAPYQRERTTEHEMALSAYAEGTTPRRLAEDAHRQTVEANRRFAAQEHEPDTWGNRARDLPTKLLNGAILKPYEMINNLFGGDYHTPDTTTALMRETGTYQGGDAIDQATRDKARVNTRIAAYARGEMPSMDATNALLEPMVRKYGKDVDAVTGGFTDVALAANGIGSNNPFAIARSMGVKGSDALIAYLQESGQGNVAGQIPAYLKTMADFDGSEGVLKRDAAETSMATGRLQTLTASGAYGGSAPYEEIGQSLQKNLKDLQQKLETELRTAGNTVNAQEIAVQIQNLYTSIASNVHAANAAAYGYESSQASVTGSQGAITTARTNLWGNAGDFTANALPQQQKALTQQITADQKQIDSLPEGAERNSLIAHQNMLKAQQMMLPAQAQAQDIGRAEMGFGANRAELGTGTAYGSLYGTAGDITGAGNANIGQIQRERQYWQNLNPESRQQDAERRSKLAQLDQQEMQVRAGVATSTTGIAREQAGMRLGETGLGIQAGTAFGSDADVRSAYGAQRAERESQISTLTARANDNSLPREVRMQAQRDLLQQRVGMMDDSIRGRDTEIGREETRGGLRRGDTEFGLDKARRMGGSGDYRSAVGAQMGEFAQESSEVDAQLAQGGLTFDQEARLRRRQQGLRRDSFNLQQQSIDEGYHKEDLEGYDVARLQSRGNTQRSRMLPFGQGNGLALELGQIGQNNARRGTLAQRLQWMKQTGNDSPERRMALLREDDSLQTENMEYWGHMAHGMEDYLPAVSAGAPSGLAHFNTLNLAAGRMAMAGSPMGNYGYAGGRHEAMQQGMLRNLTGGPSPLSGAGGMNMPISGSRADWAQGDQSGQIVALLTQIAHSLTQSNGIGGGVRPGEVRGALGGALESLINPGQGKGAQFGR